MEEREKRKRGKKNRVFFLGKRKIWGEVKKVE